MRADSTLYTTFHAALFNSIISIKQTQTTWLKNSQKKNSHHYPSLSIIEAVVAATLSSPLVQPYTV